MTPEEAFADMVAQGDVPLDKLDHWAAVSPNKLFVHYGEDSVQLSYAQFKAVSDRLAAGLLACGVREGDAVSVLTRNSLVSAIAMFAIWRAGCLFAPINFNFKGPQLSYQLGDTKPTALITDPDLLNNHGLDEAGNAAHVVALIERLRAGGPVVFDEVIHGHAREPGLWALLFRYPLVLATMQALLVAFALGLATRGRFGPPAAVPPPIAAGKDFLIAHTATLLRHGGHDAAMLRRYLVSTVTQVRTALHAPG